MKKIKTIMWQYLWDYNPINQNETKKIRQTINFENLWELIVKFNWLESDIEPAFCEIINDRNHEFGMMIITQMSFIQKNNILDKYISRRINIIWSKLEKFYYIFNNTDIGRQFIIMFAKVFDWHTI